MESVAMKNPKDDKITNKDNAITNKENNSPGKAEETKPKKEKVLTVISDNDNAGLMADESASNKGQGPAGENL